jgi:hypothetical protein
MHIQTYLDLQSRGNKKVMLVYKTELCTKIKLYKKKNSHALFWSLKCLLVENPKQREKQVKGYHVSLYFTMQSNSKGTTSFLNSRDGFA